MPEYQNSKIKYDIQPIEKFGRHLLLTNDLDPVYVALVELGKAPKGKMMGRQQMCRWLIAYWCYYHCGAASWLSEHEAGAFWKWMRIAAQNKQASPLGKGTRWPRGHERRHARGDQAVSMVDGLKKMYGSHPEAMIDHMTTAAKRAPSYEGIAKFVQTHKLFGPWIAFKVCDMIDRVLGTCIDFTEAAVFMFKDPVKAIDMLREERKWPKKTNEQVIKQLKTSFKNFKAPPLYDRPVDLQEVETVLCKWKSHMNGHYGPYHDINEIREGLVGWGETADKFLAAMPEGGNEWKLRK